MTPFEKEKFPKLWALVDRITTERFGANRADAEKACSPFQYPIDMSIPIEDFENLLDRIPESVLAGIDGDPSTMPMETVEALGTSAIPVLKFLVAYLYETQIAMLKYFSKPKSASKH